jgi:hypothetical protein
MNSRSGISVGRALLGLAVVVAAGAAGYFALGGRLGPSKEMAPPNDALELRNTDPKLIAYEEIDGIPTGMDEVGGLAVDQDGRVYVAGGALVRVFDAGGARLREFPTGGGATSLAVAPAAAGSGVPASAAPGAGATSASAGSPSPGGRVFVAMKNRVEVYDANGGRLAAWGDFDPNSMFSSIAVGERDVFLSDDNVAEVLRCDLSGKVIGRIGREEASTSVLLRSPHFDVSLGGGDGLLWITNPGRLRVEAYTFAGDQKVSWGIPSMAIDGFSGCCNPKDIAFLPDGGVVTSEKGFPRVKVYDRSGKFRCVVAGAESFDPGVHYLDLAVDRAGRVLVLDPAQKKVRIFVKKKQT